ncbi:MAG: Lpg1974 family pore-forming outer membrane protein [Simkaniaceae bacterium]|nr:Lpg1974 family pore-forming outer membrane protein [Simkaniaceae bacterium]
MRVSFLKKALPAVASLVATSLAFSGSDMSYHVSQLERPMQQTRQERGDPVMTLKGADGMPGDGTGMDNGYGLYITVAPNYRRAHVGGTEYACFDKRPTGGTPPVGKVRSVRGNWDWGLSVGVGYNFVRDMWNAKLDYTWFSTGGSDAFSVPASSSSILPLLGRSSLSDDPDPGSVSVFTFCQDASSSYKLEHHLLSSGLGRTYPISGRISLHPHFGVQLVWFGQRQTTSYKGGEPQISTPLQDGPTITITKAGLGDRIDSIVDRSDTFGVGPSLGTCAKWYLGSGFSFCSAIDGALIATKFRIKHDEELSGEKNGPTHVTASRQGFSPTAHLGVGLRYDRCMHQGFKHLSAGISYDTRYWWRQRQTLRVDEASVIRFNRSSEDIGFYGLTLDVKLDF